MEFLDIFIYKGVDYTDSTIIMDDYGVRKNIGNAVFSASFSNTEIRANNSVVTNMICSINNAANGVLTLNLPKANSANLRIASYYWDLVSNTNGYINMEKRGVVHILPTITRG